MLLCCAWNGGLFWLSIWLFNGLIIPGLQFSIHLIFGGSSTHNLVWSWVGPMLSWTFSALWVLPLFLLSKLVNSLWFQDIADAAYRRTRGRPQMLPTFGKIIADILFSLLLQGLFLIQGTLAVFLPITVIGQLISLLHMCLLYSLYAFEYKWFSMGWEVHKRLSYVESNWPYFVGFGLPLAILTSVPSSTVISGCIFSMLFPLLIVSANEAEPTDEKFNYRLRLFTPVIVISNAIFQHSVRKTNRNQVAPPSQSSSATRRQVRLQERWMAVATSRHNQPYLSAVSMQCVWCVRVLITSFSDRCRTTECIFNTTVECSHILFVEIVVYLHVIIIYRKLPFCTVRHTLESNIDFLPRV